MTEPVSTVRSAGLLSTTRGVRRLAVAAAVGMALVTTACGSSGSAATPSPSAGTGLVRIVAGENVWGDIARQIGASHVRATSIISDPNTDPHEYETNPGDAAAVAEASLVIENGAGYDDFLAKEVAAAGGSRRVLTVQKVVGVNGDDANPHLWYSPAYVTKTARAIASALAGLDPAGTEEFQANLGTFLRAYQPYLDTIATIKAKYGGTAIAYTERVPGYLIAAAGLHLGTPAGFSRAVEDGTDPTPQDTAAFDADLAQHKVAVLLYNAQVTDTQTTKIKQVARAAGVPVIGVSETLPPAYRTFQAWQIAQARALLAALGG